MTKPMPGAPSLLRVELGEDKNLHSYVHNKQLSKSSRIASISSGKCQCFITLISLAEEKDLKLEQGDRPLHHKQQIDLLNQKQLKIDLLTALWNEWMKRLSESSVEMIVLPSNHSTNFLLCHSFKRQLTKVFKSMEKYSSQWKSREKTFAEQNQLFTSDEQNTPTAED